MKSCRLPPSEVGCFAISRISATVVTGNAKRIRLRFLSQTEPDGSLHSKISEPDERAQTTVRPPVGSVVIRQSHGEAAPGWLRLSPFIAVKQRAERPPHCRKILRTIAAFASRPI
jgi:hypothetical protein